ncbi:unnamed protein product, partial [marine sediment metagenome]
MVNLPTITPELLEALNALTVDIGVVTAPVAVDGNSLNDSSKAWGTNIHRNRLIRIVGGQGKGQVRIVSGNTGDSLIVSQ